MSAPNTHNKLVEEKLAVQADGPPDLHQCCRVSRHSSLREALGDQLGDLNDASKTGYARSPLLPAVRDRRSGKDDTTEQEMLDLLRDSAAGSVTRPFFKHANIRRTRFFCVSKIQMKQEKESQDGIVVTLGLQ